MKKILLFTLILLAVITFIKGQGLEARTYLEQTHVSPKFGTALGYSFADEIEVGGFFQRATQMTEAETGRPLKAENEFYGAYFAYPLFSGEETSVKFNVRTGVSNGENFVITPSIMANYQPLKNISIGGGIGTRAFRPTYMASISIRLISQSKTPTYLAAK